MAKIFITGSTDGLGLFAAQQLVSSGHQVYAHARSSSRAEEVKEKLKGVTEILVGDLSNIEATKQLAVNLNAKGRFDAIIHNAGVLSAPSEAIFQINVLAPYILTAAVEKPQRLIYLSSGMHRGGKPLRSEADIDNTSYSDSKLHIIMLTKAVARLYPLVYANAVDPGWVPTKMGGSGASDDLQKGYETQVWLATSQDKEATVSGYYFYHQQQQTPKQEVNDQDLQEKLLEICAEKSGVPFGVGKEGNG